MPNRIEELFAELAESAGGQQQFQMDQQLQQMEAQRQLHQTPEFRNALKIMGILGLLAAPIPGSNTLAARLGLGQAGKPLLNKAYGATGGDFRKFIIPPLSDVGRRLTGRSGALTGRSGARVGTDVAERTGLGRLIFGPLTQPGRSGSRVGTDAVGRNPLPKIKDPVVTKQGPRGPINIDSPKQLPLKGLEDARYTKGLSETDREMIKRLLIPPLTKTGQRATQVSAKETARKARVEIKKLERWKKGHQAKVRRGDDQYQEGSRSGYEPDIKGGEKMMRESRKRIREIQAKLDELNKLL